MFCDLQGSTALSQQLDPEELGDVIRSYKVDAELVMRMRESGESWAEIAELHPPLKLASGRKVRPSVGSIRRAFSYHNTCTEEN